MTPALSDTPLENDVALALADSSLSDTRTLMRAAARRRDRTWGKTLTFSPKVFLPLTNLCRNDCDYCAFRRSAGDRGERTMAPSAVELAIAEAAACGCIEALFCLGDRPETAFVSYRRRLEAFGHESTVSYLHWAAGVALAQGLLPHTNAGVLTREEMVLLREVNVSLGLMLETTSDRLRARGAPHHRAPDKRPARRLRMLVEAGELKIPFTTGILVGIGETRRERIEALIAIRDLHRRFGHIQEVIVQNFTPHPSTPMERTSPPSDDDIAHAVAMARLILDDDVSVQAPPNLNPSRTRLLLDAGINDFGGISPVTRDFINPSHPWPRLPELAREVAPLGFSLRPRLAIYDGFLEKADFIDRRLLGPVATARQRSIEFEASGLRPLPVRLDAELS